MKNTNSIIITTDKETHNKLKKIAVDEYCSMKKIIIDEFIDICEKDEFTEISETVLIRLELPEIIYNQLKDKSKETGFSMSKLLKIAIDKKIKKNENIF